MKRFTHLPQVFLAAAFGWAIPMAYVAITGTTDIWCWLLFLAYMCWTVAYDTQYAMADRDDDLKIGVKSTAILFGRFDVVIVSVLQSLFLLIMGLVLWHYLAPTSLGITPIFGLALVAMMFAKQNSACASRQASACFQAFLANIWVGRYVLPWSLYPVYGQLLMDKLRKSPKRQSTQTSLNERSVSYQLNLNEQGLTREQVITTERKLAKFANAMDSVVRIPFTKQGIGADAALSTIPLMGDLAGLILTSYAFMLGRRLGVPASKMTPAVRLALIDMVVGVIPGIGTLLDIFIRPSRKTLSIVHQHIHDEYGITETTHMDRPFCINS